MKIIDAHTHIFEQLTSFRGEGEIRAIGGGKARWADGETVTMIPPGLGEKEFLAETLIKLLKDNGIERAVLLQGSFYGFHNEYISETMKKYPEMFLGAGTFDPFSRCAGRIYDRLTGELGFKVIKFETSTGGGLMSYHCDYNIFDTFDEIAGRMEENGQILVLDIGSPGMSSFQPEAVASLARKHSGLNIIICHLLAPTLKDESELERGLKLLQADNIWFDLAAVPFNVRPETYPYPTGRKYVKMAKEIVGYQKLLWGTDVPSVLVYDSYQNLLSFVAEGNLFAPEELQAVLYGNAVDAYRWL